ncbi:methyltransferase domain-containing protein [Streptomyces sp. NPDC047081]|uniref:class I SAM-dependent methyltransferase n=1 Tax=Streptomyces sp. NPDC047081 TaxID=3154706 RepID=UPI0033C846AC
MADEPGFQLTDTAADRYEHYVAPVMAPFVTAILDAVDLYPGATVLDLACGTGFAARAAAAQVGPTGRVFGADVNEGMLRVAKAHHPRHYPDIEFTTAPADRLPYPDAHFDAVVCQQGAQFFPDLEAALTETARVTRPGGRFAATTWSPTALTSPYMSAQHKIIKEYGGQQAAASFAAAFSCTPDRLTTALHTAGFQEAKAHELAFGITLPPLTEFAPGHLSVLPWAQQILEAEGPTALTEAGRTLATRLTPHAPTFTFTAILATATR